MRTTLLLLLLTSCLLACPAPREVMPSSPPDAAVRDVLASVVATCAEVHGSAQVRRGGKPYWEELAPGSILRDGDWVRTGPEASARVELLAGQRLELGPDAVVVIEARGVDAGAGAPRVAIEAGEVRATAPEEDALVPLILRDRNGKTTVVQPRAGERTVLRLSASDAGTELAVLRGAAEVQAPEQRVSLERGQAVTSDGTRPLVTAELPDFPTSLAPGIDARLKFDADAGVRLEWTSVPGATGYRVQLANDLAFAEGVRTVEVTAPGLFLRAGTKGQRVWRVATRAAQTVGEYGFARRVFFEAEEPVELLLGPEAGQVISFSNALPTITFSWQGTSGSPSYRLVVSHDADPRIDPVLSLVTTTQQAVVASLGAGEYHWGVYLEGAEPKPLFLAPRTLTIKSVSRAVVKTPRSVTDWE